MPKREHLAELFNCCPVIQSVYFSKFQNIFSVVPIKYMGQYTAHYSADSIRTPVRL